MKWVFDENFYTLINLDAIQYFKILDKNEFELFSIICVLKSKERIVLREVKNLKDAITFLKYFLSKVNEQEFI